jgi:hypothetical protein
MGLDLCEIAAVVVNSTLAGAAILLWESPENPIKTAGFLLICGGVSHIPAGALPQCRDFAANQPRHAERFCAARSALRRRIAARL